MRQDSLPQSQQHRTGEMSAGVWYGCLWYRLSRRYLTGWRQWRPAAMALVASQTMPVSSGTRDVEMLVFSSVYYTTLTFLLLLWQALLRVHGAKHTV